MAKTKLPSKKLGGIKSNDSKENEKRNNWNGEHRRTGVKLPGTTDVWLEEAEHYLAMAVCNYQGHMPQPCHECLHWANQELAFAMHFWRSTHELPDIHTGVARDDSNSGTDRAGHAGQVEGKKTGKSANGGRVKAGPHRPRTKKG